MVNAVADEGLDGIVLNVGIGMGGGLQGTSAERLGHHVRREPAWSLPRRSRRAPPARGREQHRLHQFRGRPQAGKPPPRVRRVEGGTLGLCRHVALEGARRGVRANVIAPGLIDTPLGRIASAGRPSRERTPVPLGRQGTAWEVAAATVFLLSDDASYITGQTLAVDGGLTLL